ncbi:MAG TPA: phage head closure protein [Saliniramus sp.]|nr:phage head closure protein [Saliniramus sp.]
MIRSSIGARRRLFVIETPLDTPDGFGGILRAYQPGPAVWGALEPLSGDERKEAGATHEVVTHRVRIRYRQTLGANDRLALGPRRFRVRTSREADDKRRELLCLVEEIKP